MSVNMTLDNVCRGCLSVDRKIVPLKDNASLFFILIADQYIPQNSNYFNMHLCWECIGLLKKVAMFQERIQKSKDIFIKNWGYIDTLVPSSRLCVSHKNTYDYTIDYERDLIEGEMVDGKPTVMCDDSTDIFDRSDYTDNTSSATAEEKTACKIKARITNAVYEEGVIDIDKYVDEVDLSVRELETFERNKRGLISCMSYRSNVLLKKILLAKKQDLKTFSFLYPEECSLCSKQLLSRTNMKAHWHDHTIKMKKCRFCDFLGDEADDIMDHVKKRHKKIYTCYCGEQFRSFKVYHKHHKNLHKQFDCDHCKRSFPSRTSIERHMVKCHLSYKCKICHRDLKSHRVLMKHYSVCHSDTISKVVKEKPYCVECDLTFLNDYLYKRHLRSAVAHRPRSDIQIPCPECGKIFTRKSYMTNHYNLVHVRKSKHYCEICDKYFITGYAIRTHKKFVHEKIEKPKDKKCEICDRGFFTNRVLINHMRTHTGERPYKCMYCAAAFAQRSAMKTHERTQHKDYL